MQSYIEKTISLVVLQEEQLVGIAVMEDVGSLWVIISDCLSYQSFIKWFKTVQ